RSERARSLPRSPTPGEASGPAGSPTALTAEDHLPLRAFLQPAEPELLEHAQGGGVGGRDPGEDAADPPGAEGPLHELLEAFGGDPPSACAGRDRVGELDIPAR